MRLPQRAAQLGLSHFLLAKDIFNGPMAWLLLLKFHVDGRGGLW